MSGKDNQIAGKSARILLVDEVVKHLGCQLDSDDIVEKSVICEIHAVDGSVDTWVEVEVTYLDYSFEAKKEIAICRIYVNGKQKFVEPGQGLSMSYVLDIAQQFHDTEVNRLRKKKKSSEDDAFRNIPNYGAF